MTLRDSTSTLQRLLGIAEDGDYGPITAAHAIEAVRERNALRERLSPPGLAGTATAAGGVTVGPDGVKPLSGDPAGDTGPITPSPASPMRLSDKGAALIHSFEQCRLEAYPDPGSSNGEPWTIGWGSTGPGIQRGTVWTQAQADERFKADVAGRERRLNQILAGTPTTQAQFDALLSLGYNIGMDALAGSTVMRRHKAGDHPGAATAFGMWVKNDGKVMRGLVTRRAKEAEFYRGQP